MFVFEQILGSEEERGKRCTRRRRMLSSGIDQSWRRADSAREIAKSFTAKESDRETSKDGPE